ncbi:MAG: hypothetical protein ACRCU6_10190 [Fusobacteriaceae bacterium]
MLGPMVANPTGTNRDDYFIQEYTNDVRIPFINNVACIYGPRYIGYGWGICTQSAGFTTISGQTGSTNNRLNITSSRELKKLRELRGFSYTRFIDYSENEYFLNDIENNTLVFDRNLNGNTLFIEASGSVVYFSPSPSIDISIGDRDNFIVYLSPSQYQYPVEYNIHPVGNKQNLSIGSLSLDLEGCDFNGDFIYSGYRRMPLKNLSYTIDYLPMGPVSVSGRKFRPRFSFEWDLILSFDKLSQLMAIKEEQEFKIRGYADSIGIRLIDGRLSLLEQLPRQRAKARQSISQSAPIGYEYITPVFQIYISEIMEELFIPSKNIWKVKVIAQELDILAPNYDIV